MNYLKGLNIVTEIIVFQTPNSKGNDDFLKRKWAVLLIIAAIVFAIPSYYFFKINKTEEVFVIDEEPQRSFYRIECELDVSDKTLTAIQTVDYYNNDDIEMHDLYFHVYPNAFKEKTTVPFLFGDFDNAYNRGFEPGYAEILAISKLEGGSEKLLNYSLSREGNTILKVELDKPIKPGGRADMKISFKLYIPPASERFGYGENHFNLGNWYPIAAVYDDKDGWNLDKYYPIGDPFFSDASDYLVSIKAPEDYVIAASGKNINKSSEEGYITWDFEGTAIRDFAFVANNKFNFVEQKLDGISIKSYFYNEDEEKGKEALEYGVKAIKTFNKLYGKYPYSDYSIVETVFPSGMEYPTLVYISDKLYKSDFSSDPLIITVVHETAHQWFYGIVGNDQIDESWLDEGFAAYSEILYAENIYGKKTGRDYYIKSVEEGVEDALSANVIDGLLSKSLSEFDDWSDYGPTAYGRGAQLLHRLRVMLGDDMFFKVLKTYVEKYKFEIAYVEDFIMVCEDVSGKDLSGFFELWLDY